ncbi:hypothetical protein SIN09_07470 [Streptomyces sp. F8]|uniref:hypothetical protein n=1 Tax=Streptomyces sp. F8 TaxID=1436085 RepID=UPI0029CB2D36|nr:hypothetical protein [Streptomyces sp. F8]MDX6759286.1 hypothetical protein [Streptomyces sp. F8]
MVGPALAGVLAVTVHPASALVLAAGLVLVFGTLFAVHPTAPGPVGGFTTTGARGGVRLWSPGLVLLFTMPMPQGAAWSGANRVSTRSPRLWARPARPGSCGRPWP